VSIEIAVAGVAYFYDTEPAAGITFVDDTRWWGTHVKWRRGASGRWHRCTLVDVHPFDTDQVEAGLRAYLADRRQHR